MEQRISPRCLAAENIPAELSGSLFTGGSGARLLNIPEPCYHRHSGIFMPARSSPAIQLRCP